MTDTKAFEGVRSTKSLHPTAKVAICLHAASQDDQVVELEPITHEDYLSYEWKEEHIWPSWTYIVHKRKRLANSVRLENASWRQWMKTKNDTHC